MPRWAGSPDEEAAIGRGSDRGNSGRGNSGRGNSGRGNSGRGNSGRSGDARARGDDADDAEPPGLLRSPGVRGQNGVHFPPPGGGPAGLDSGEPGAGAEAADYAAAELAVGLELRQKRRLTAAAGYLERAVEADPRLAEAWFWLAVTRDNLGREAEAVPAYRQALTIGIDDPNRRAQAQMWLASSLSKTGQHQAALAALAEAGRLGGYEPAGEYIRLRRAIWRRSASARRKSS
jgi:tetratricopeptide (TPR) repeat protein